MFILRIEILFYLHAHDKQAPDKEEKRRNQAECLQFWAELLINIYSMDCYA